jgi:hypothetical protein
VLTERFVDGAARPVAGTRAATNVSVFTGERRLAGIPAVRSVRFDDVWRGIDVELHARGDNVEKIVTVAPGAAPDAIRLRVGGASALRIGSDGSLLASTGNGPLSFARPVAFQESAAGRKYVDVRYRIAADTYGFELGAYDATRPIVIDPIIQSTYLGGSGSSFADEGVRDMAIHPTSGEVYVAGFTDSANFPGTTGGAFPTGGASGDAFVARLSADLTTLLQATYLAGNETDEAHALIVTATDVYVAGSTGSSNFPATAGSAQSADPNAGAALNGFIARLPLSLTSLTAATYLGGTTAFDTSIFAMLPHPNGDFYVCGPTRSTTLPNTAGGFAPTNSGPRAAFVARIDAALSAFAQLTYFGANAGFSSNSMSCTALAADPGSGELYIGGRGDSGTALPNLTGGALATGNAGAWAARLNAALTQNPQTTWLAQDNSGSTPSVHSLLRHPANGDLYVLTDSRTGASLPPNATAGGGQTTCNGGLFNCLLVMRLNTSLTGVVAGTFYGTAASSIVPRGFNHMTIDPVSGDVFAASDGHAGLPNTAGGFQPAAPAGAVTPGFIVRIRNDLGAIVQASYIGGNNATRPVGVALHPANGHLYVAGSTSSDNFPLTSGGAQAAFAGNRDAFVTRVTPDLLGAGSPGTLQFASATYIVSEGTSTAQITVSRSGGTSAAVSVQYATANGTATAGSDYTAASGTLNWADGDGATKSFTVNITDDSAVESSETVNLALSGETGGATIGSQSSAVLTITDNDVAPPAQPGALQLSAASYSGNENGGSVTLTLTRTAGTDGAVGVSVASGGGSAAAGADYTALTTTVTWAAGDGELKTVSLALLDDSIDEADETVTITLSNATGGATLGAQSTATVTIVDDDLPPAPPPPPAQTTTARGSYGGGTLGTLSVLILAALAALGARRRVALATSFIVGIAIASATPPVAAADRESHAYLGARGVFTRSDLDAQAVERGLSALGYTGARATLDEERFGGGLQLGYRFARGATIELGVLDLGEYEVEATALTADPSQLARDVERVLGDAGLGVTLTFGWDFPLGQRLTVTPRLGAVYWDSETQVSTVAARFESSGDAVDFTAGISLGWRFGEAWRASLAYDHYDTGPLNEIRALSIGLEYRF